jgi:hypothetical protein
MFKLQKLILQVRGRGERKKRRQGSGKRKGEKRDF